MRATFNEAHLLKLVTCRVDPYLSDRKIGYMETLQNQKKNEICAISDCTYFMFRDFLQKERGPFKYYCTDFRSVWSFEICRINLF